MGWKDQIEFDVVFSPSTNQLIVFLLQLSCISLPDVSDAIFDNDKIRVDYVHHFPIDRDTHRVDADIIDVMSFIEYDDAV